MPENDRKPPHLQALLFSQGAMEMAEDETPGKSLIGILSRVFVPSGATHLPKLWVYLNMFGVSGHFTVRLEWRKDDETLSRLSREWEHGNPSRAVEIAAQATLPVRGAGVYKMWAMLGEEVLGRTAMTVEVIDNMQPTLDREEGDWDG
jgi:hypothetical protein